MEILKFEQPKCAPCESVDKYLVENGIEVQHINAWDKPDLAGRHKVRSCPTIVVLDHSGQEVFRTVGVKPDELKKLKNFK